MKTIATIFNGRGLTWAILASCMLIGIYIRVHGANAYDYSGDETQHLSIAQGTALKDVLSFSRYESHPPLFYFFLHYWLKISGNMAFARGLSLVFGIGMIPLYYLIGKELNGKYTGLYAAALITFSHVCIIQSYLLRQYSVCLFFLSGAFYCFMLWRKSFKGTMLLAYACAAMLACLSHFSVIFALATIAAYQSIIMIKNKAPAGKQVSWIIVNFGLALIWSGLYYLWLPELTLASPYSNSTAVFNVRFFASLISPGQIFSQQLSSEWTACIILFAAMPIALLKEHKNGFPFILMPCMAMALFMALILSGVYFSMDGSRHNMWMVPFIILFSACGIGDASEWLSDRLAKKYDAPWTFIILVLFIAAQAVFYNSQERFYGEDHSEYDFKTEVIDELKSYLQALGPDSVIIAEKDEIFRIKNVYPYLGNSPFTGEPGAVKIPYYHTAIVFNPYYRRLRTKAAFLATIEAAEKLHMLDNIHTLVFPRAWAISSLMDCNVLHNYIVNLPLNRESEAYFSLLVISKKDFFEQILSPQGNAYNCLQDIPGTEYFIEPAPHPSY